MTEAVEFQRNPGLTRDQIEETLKESLQLEKVIWMKKGVAEGECHLQCREAKVDHVQMGSHLMDFYPGDMYRVLVQVVI